MLTKAVASFRGDDDDEGGRIISRRQGRRQGEDGKLQPSRLGHTTAEGPPACHGETWWARAAGLLVFGVENYWGAWAWAVSRPVEFVTFVVDVVPPPLQGEGRRAAKAQMHQDSGLWDGG
jgi:hypothetical protein